MYQDRINPETRLWRVLDLGFAVKSLGSLPGERQGFQDGQKGPMKKTVDNMSGNCYLEVKKLIIFRGLAYLKDPHYYT